MADMSLKSPAVQTSTMAPAPVTERGFGLHITSTSRDGWMVYCNGRSVILRAIADPTTVRVFGEHKNKVNVARFSPNGRHVASGDDGGQLIIWEVLKDRFSVRKEFPINKGIKDLSWSDDGKRLAVCGKSDGGSFALAILVDSGNTVGDVSGHDQTVLSIDYRKHRPFRIATASEDRTVGFYKGPPFQFMKSFKGHTNFVTCVRFSNDGSQFITTSNDMKINLFDGATGDHIRELKQPKKEAHKGTIYSGSWSPDNSQILTASSDKTCKIWNKDEGTCAATFRFGEDVKRPELDDMQVSCLWHDKDTLLSVSLSGAINYLNPAAPEDIKSLHGCQRLITSMVVDRTNQVVWTGESGGQVTKWDMSTKLGRWLSRKNPGSAVKGMRLVDGTLQVITVDDKMRSHDATNGVRADDKKVAPVAIGGALRCLANCNTNPNMCAIALAQDKMVIMYNGQITHTQALGFEPLCCAFAYDDSCVYVGGKNKGVMSFTMNLEAGTCAPTAGFTKLATHDNCDMINVHPDGGYLVAIDKKKSLCVFDLKTGENTNEAVPLRYHDATIRSSAYSPNGSKLATAGADGRVYIWYDGIVDAHRLGIEAHYQSVAHVRWLDENTIVTAGDELCLKTWTVPDVWA
jgi:WD40 repeat protein